jgi:ActR/RegA family two-component response regulator
MDRAEILNALREVGRVQDAEDANESTTLTRLQEHQIKRVVARHEYYAGNQQRLDNQHRTGVIRK